MKVKKLLAGMISAAVVIGAMTVSVFAEDNYVAKIGDNYYTTLKDAMQAACNMNVETVDGIPTQTTPVTIEITADIENQEGFYVRGGQKLTTYGSHYVHNIDITINGNGYKIDTGVYGCENPDVKASPKIGVASMNGKFTVKNVIVPNDLVFDLSKTYDDVLSECSQRESGQADSLTIENCAFYGSNVAYAGAVNSVIYKNNKFLLTENTNNGADSYPLWYKFNNAIKNFVFEGNTVKAQRALNLARFSENSEIIVNNNSFTIANTKNIAKSAAIMLAENHTAEHPYKGNLTFNGNTVDAYTAVVVYAPSEYNTNFSFTAKDNTLSGSTKLVGYNEWSGTFSNEDNKKAAEGLIKALADKADTGTTDPEILANSLYVTYSEPGSFDFGSGEADSIKLTLFAGVDTLDYSSVGFDVTVGKETQSFPITTVYTSVKTMLGGKETTVKAADFGSGVNYIFGQTINFPATTEFADASANWTPFAMKNGKKITVKTFNLADIFPGTLN